MEFLYNDNDERIFENVFNNYNSGINTINNKNEFVTKEKMENALNEQKNLAI